MQTVAIGALVTELTGSAAWGAWIAAVTYLLSGLVTPYGGVVADHHDRRRLLIGVAIFQAVLAVVLAAVYSAGNMSPFAVLAFVAIEGVCVALLLPARGAIVPSVVARDDLESATALGSASWNLGRMVGPALAGVVVLMGSYTPIFVINAISFVLVAVALAFVRVPRHRPDPNALGALQRVQEGFVAVRNEPGCWLAVRMMAYLGIFIAPFIALVPAMGQLVFRGGPEATAQLVVAQGVGAVLGAVLMNSYTQRLGRNRATRATLLCLPVASIAYALSPSLLLASAAMTLLGMLYVWALVSLNVVVQLRVDESHRGRALSLLFCSLSLFYPVGAALLGWAADHVGVREVLVGAALTYLAGLLVLVLLRPRSLDVLDGLPAVSTGDRQVAPTTVG